jgi:hypothetical protein
MGEKCLKQCSQAFYLYVLEYDNIFFKEKAATFGVLNYNTKVQNPTLSNASVTPTCQLA